MKQYLVLILFLIMAIMSFGKGLWMKDAIKLPPSVCYASPEIHKSFVKPPAKLKAGSLKKSNIIVDFVGFPDSAKVAFLYAVDIWENLIYSPIPIRIKAIWESLDSDVLGSCGPSDFIPNFNSTQIWNCYYPIALAEKMLGQELNSSTGYEMEASFNKDFSNWYFGIDGNTPKNKYDFVSTALHELTHGLGFTGFFYSDSRGRGGYGGSDGLAATFDQFVRNKSGEKLVDKTRFTNPSITLNQNLTSGWLEFKSALIEGTLPRLYAPSTYDSGSSIYHLNDATYPAGDPNSLMTHAMGKGEANHNPGPNVEAMMYEMGWKSISIKHKQIKDIEFATDSISFDAQIESDFELDSTKIHLVYSSNKFLNKDSVRLKATSIPSLFNAKLFLKQLGEVQYYFSANDKEKRNFVFPSNSPTRYLSFKIGVDKTAPVITHEPIKSILSSNPSVKIKAIATDNIGIKSVKVRYFVNDGPTINEFALSNDSADHYSGMLNFPLGTVKGGDFVSYQIVATDVSSQNNVGQLPVGYYKFKIEGIQNPVARYVTSFDASNQDFIGSDFTISTATGFDNAALNSAHPYLSPDTDNTEFNFSTILRYPITLNSKGKMTFDEIVLVEPGEVGAEFGDENFWDYVVVEGSADGGNTWKPFADGYDSNAQKSWATKWNSAISGNNSTAVPTKDLLVKHEINMLANGNFKPGDVVLIRFRLFSDPYSHGWGWMVDNLAIQDWETAASPLLLSSGEVNFFPNPANNQLNIQVDAQKTIQNLILKAYNSSGKQVFNQYYPVGSNLFQTAIDVSTFIPGLYLFTLEPENGQVIVRKIVIQ